MAKKLIYDLEELEICKGKIDDYTDVLTNIQNNLKDIIDELTESGGGWDSAAAKEFIKSYDSSWTEGINDRIDVMKRMSEHLNDAITEYTSVTEQLDGLNITFDN